MKTKIVYVVCSNENDFYLEQTIISLYSLRMHNPNAHVVLVTDNFTSETLKGNRKQILNYISEHIIVELEEKSLQKSSRILKTTLRNRIEGDYLFIDSDTIICDSLESIDDIKYDIGAVLDRHYHLSDHPFKKDIEKWGKYADWQISPTDDYFNSGVFYVKDNIRTRTLYKKWSENIIEAQKRGGYLDQPSLGKANSICGNIIKELPGEWNCQIMENGLNYLYNAKIIHYYAAFRGKHKTIKSYLLSNKNYYILVKESDVFPPEIIELLEKPKSAFTKDNYICCGDELDSIRTIQFQILKKVKVRFPRFSNLIDNILTKCVHLIQK